MAGGGELPTRKLDSSRIVRVGETTAEAMLEKATCVASIMRHRISKLKADEALISAVDVYTRHPLEAILNQVLISEIPAISRHGICWYYSQPPICDIEFEMDLRGVFSEVVVDLAKLDA